jgi:hypothetical protein
MSSYTDLISGKAFSSAKGSKPKISKTASGESVSLSNFNDIMEFYSG